MTKMMLEYGPYCPSGDVIEEPIQRLRPFNRVIDSWINQNDPMNRAIRHGTVGGMVLPRSGKLDPWIKEATRQFPKLPRAKQTAAPKGSGPGGPAAPEPAAASTVAPTEAGEDAPADAPAGGNTDRVPMDVDTKEEVE